MGIIDVIDRWLTNLVNGIESVTAVITRAADYTLRWLADLTSAVLRLVRRILRVVYRFIRDLTVNLIKVAWNLLGVSLIFLVFAFVWAVGSELRQDNWSVLGWSLQILGGGGIAFVAFALLASFSRSASDAPGPRRRAHALFGSLNSIAILAVVVFGYARPYLYQNRLLSGVQVSVSRLIVSATSAEEMGAAPASRKLREVALRVLEPPRLPAEEYNRLDGGAHFESDSLLAGTLTNNGTWTVLALHLVFKGPEDKKLPDLWERSCIVKMRLRPHETTAYQCPVDPVDLRQRWRWERFVPIGWPPD